MNRLQSDISSHSNVSIVSVTPVKEASLMALPKSLALVNQELKAKLPKKGTAYFNDVERPDS
jgi:hypothetical protein